MKKIVLVFSVAVLAVVLSNPVAAQQASDQTKLTYEVLTEEWGNLIGGVLDLTEAEAEQELQQMRAELWQNGQLLEEEERTLTSNIYFKNELVLMLQRAGFA